jgi:hypothetical protein
MSGKKTRPLGGSGGLGFCVECGWHGPVREGVLCEQCDTRHWERTRRQELTREALAWAFVTIVFFALVAWGVSRLFASGVLVAHL